MGPQRAINYDTGFAYRKWVAVVGSTVRRRGSGIAATGARSDKDMDLDYTMIAEKIFQRGYDAKGEGEPLRNRTATKFATTDRPVRWTRAVLFN